MIPLSDRPRPIFTLRTDELAGRGDELAKLERVLQDLQETSDKTLFFYIAGDGGLGKTRLLEWVRDDYQFPSNTVCTQILDLYNSILRTNVDLVEHIYDNIAPFLEQIPDKELTHGFEHYRELRQRFYTQQLSAAGGDIGSRVIDAFVAAWTPLAEHGFRAVVLLDTAELLRFEDDPVRRRFNALEPVASTKRLLLEMVDDDKKLPGVLFVVAGRKTESLQLYEEFRVRAGHGIDDQRRRVVELAGLTRQGVDEYFEKLGQALQAHGYIEQAEQLGAEEMDANLRTAFYNLTGGSPITLAIALQLFIDGDTDELPRLLNEQLEHSAAPIEDAQPRLQRALIQALAEYQTFGALSIAVRYMALARKGLTPDRLRTLLQMLQPNQPEIAFEELFGELSQQIFVKRLPDGSLVLHDKVADWTEEGLYREGGERLNRVYQALVAIYRQEITELGRQIDNLIPIADPLSSIEEGEPEFEILQSDRRLDLFAQQASRELQQRRREWRNRLIEQMSYALRGDPVQGYRLYYELAEEAFNVGRMDYEAQIRSDFLGWWMVEQPPNSGHFKYRLQAQEAGLGEELINADFAVRAVQRTYSSETSARLPSERWQNTANLVRRMLVATQTDQPEERFAIPEFATILLGVYADMARGQLAESEQEIDGVRRAFTQHIQQLDELLSKHKAARADANLEVFLVLSAQAFAYYELGFFERNHGNYGEAIKNYSRSLHPYRELRFEINQARSLNDKAYALAMVGDSNSAETAVKDALRLRKRLGFSYPIALSYNTLGIVHMLSERPVSALQYCGYALRIFRAINFDYGQMIACRALSEAARRDAERLAADDRIRYRKRLADAIRWSESAAALARSLLTSRDMQLVDVLIEYGSAYRELARFCWQNPDLCGEQPNDLAAQGEKLISEGVAIARNMPGARPQLVDALIDLARLRYYHFFSPQAEPSHALKAAEQTVQEALQEIPQPYRDLRHPDHQTLARSATIYWAHLSKAHGLLVTLARQWISLLDRNDAGAKARKPYEDNLLREAILTLYFSSLLESNVRQVRRSNQIVYAAFQTFPAEVLDAFYRQANKISRLLGIPRKKQSLMRTYLVDNFGLRE